MHFVTEKGTFVNETGTLKQISCKRDHSLLLSPGDEVELLYWFCSGFDDKLPKIKTEMYMSSDLYKEKVSGFRNDHVGFCDLKNCLKDKINPCN